MKNLDMPWRPAWELFASIGWAVAIGGLYYSAIKTDMPMRPFWYMASIGVLFFSVNIVKAWSIWSARFAIAGKGIEFMPIGNLKKISKDDRIWMGYGYDWGQKHTQRLYQLKKVEPKDWYPNKLFLHIQQAITGKKIAALYPDSIGEPWIHGLEEFEVDLDTAMDNMIGNSLIVGVTRCGKTRLLDVFISQFIFRKNSAVITIDPKGDAELKENMRRAAKAAGREKDFCAFDLAHPADSIRIDPLKNYNNVSELASRVSELMPSSGDSGDSFKAFAWDVSNAIFLGLIEINEKPTLMKLRRYVESGVDSLLLACLPAFFARTTDVTEWERRAREYSFKAIKRGPDGMPIRNEPNDREKLLGYLNMYKELYLGAGYRSEAIEALSSIYSHDATHFGKMIAIFKPELAKLTTGEIGELLSPDPSNLDDTRLATDLASLADREAIVYIGLNALADKAVAGAIGSILLTDMAAYASIRYNFREEAYNKSHPVYLTVDETAQVVNDPYIQILNMSGGAGFINTSAAQTISDFAAKLGNEDKARVMLGNYNNLFALRSKDRATQDFVAETIGETFINTIQTTKGTNSTTEKNISHFGGTISERVSENLEEKIPTEIFAMLPNWQFIGSIAGGRLIKGRVPIIVGDEA